MTINNGEPAVIHFGVKGMKWGVRKKEETSGSSSSSEPKKPNESENARWGKAAEAHFSKTTPEKLQVEGQKKLKAQADLEFPKVGGAQSNQPSLERKAANISAQAKKIDSQVTDLKKQLDSFPEGTPEYKKLIVKGDIAKLEKSRDQLLEQSEKVKTAKPDRFSDEQKIAMAVGAAVVIGGLAIYGAHKTGKLPSGINPLAAVENKRKTTDEWNTLFGDDAKFKLAPSHSSAVSDGGFFGGLYTRKAFDRPEFIIPENTVFQRLSNAKENSAGYTKGAYATFLSNDKKLYGASSEFGHKKYTLSFTAKGPTRVPDLSTVLSHLKEIEKKDWPDIDDESVFATYRNFSGGSWSGTTEQALFKSLKSAGYSAIVDDMDAGYLGDLPVVFFGDASPATAKSRSTLDYLADGVGLLKPSKKYA